MIDKIEYINGALGRGFLNLQYALKLPLGRLQAMHYKAYVKHTTEEGKKEIESRQAVEAVSDMIDGGT